MTPSWALTSLQRTALGTWYAEVKRPLPWRSTRDPYAIWVSEVMSQQTRVDTVVPYWERWMARFPTVSALAEAPLDDVLHLWAGLGYYSRARNLQQAAIEVVARFGGQMPRTVEGLRSLRGVGEYTSAAIASIAFGLPVAVVDGNVERVVCRWLRLDEDPHTARARARIREVAQAALDPAQPGDHNQAMMELGATVCTPRSPRCAACPAGAWCAAARVGDPERFPLHRSRAPSPVTLWWGLLCTDEAGRTWMGRRSEGGLLGGLWEPPLVEATCDVAAPDLERAGLHAAVHAEGQSFAHVFSHRRWVVAPTFITLDPTVDALEGYSELGWFDPSARSRLALSRLANKLLDAAPDRQQTLLHARFEIPSRRPSKERP